MPKMYSDKEVSDWLARKPKKSIAVKAIIHSSNGGILLVKPNYKKGWQIPGGGVDQQEEPRAALARELFEELSLPVAIGQLKIVGTVFRSEYENLILIYEYSEKIDDSRLFKLQEDEIDSCKFVPAQEAIKELGEYYSDFWKEWMLEAGSKTQPQPQP
jgi:8-oxo-dGTP diphosphatase